ncbi:hypothetical protein [Streptosporangium sp. KLBMP 9127]|nr:hypothetical protein [Streptosporangium sp. KLBMP 9127]
MKRRAPAVAALAAVTVTIFVLGWNAAAEPRRLSAVGTHYAVTVLIDEPGTEVLLDSGDADTVTLSAVMPDMGHALPEVVTREPDPGRFLAEGDLFPMNGVWELSIRLTGPAGEEVLTVNTLVTG